MFIELIGVHNGFWKTKHSGIKLVEKAPVRILIQKVEMIDVIVDPFRLLANYLELQWEMGAFNNRLFLTLSNKMTAKK